MLFIDSLYINESGGLRLLEYLTKSLKDQGIGFFLLADERCKGIFDDYDSVVYLKASMMERNRFYIQNKNKFSSALCFGNIPPPIRLGIPVYTYFHNINLLTLKETNSCREKAISWLKRQVFRHYKRNTDYWLVQTKNTACELMKNLFESEGRVLLFPFYELPEQLKNISDFQHGDDYVFVSDYTGAKGHEELLEAWKLLHKKGLNRTLHLTVNARNKSFIELVKKDKAEGVMVINHGFIPFNEVLDLYKKSKAIIYTSHNESLGLGLVEAITAGCDVLASDLPFTYSVCEPSAVFNPYDPESIATSVLRYEKGLCNKSKLLLSNRINELIVLLTTNKFN